MGMPAVRGEGANDGIEWPREMQILRASVKAVQFRGASMHFGKCVPRPSMRGTTRLKYSEERIGRTMTTKHFFLATILLRHPPEWWAEQQRLFLDAIKPLNKLKVEIYSLYLPTLILDAEGNLVSAAYPEEMQALIKKIDEEIQRVADSWLVHP